MSQFLKQNKELKTDSLALPTVQVQVRHRLYDYSVKEGRRRKRYSRSPNTVEVRGSVKTEDAPSAISNQQSSIINTTTRSSSLSPFSSPLSSQDGRTADLPVGLLQHVLLIFFFTLFVGQSWSWTLLVMIDGAAIASSWRRRDSIRFDPNGRYLSFPPIHSCLRK